jgi:formate dehydrogenase subunit gamma
VSPKEASDARAQQQQQAAQPLNNQPVWSEIRSGAPQITTVRGRETNVLIQPEGQTWRAVRVPILFWGGILFALALGGLAVFYMLRGTMGERGKTRGAGHRAILADGPLRALVRAIVWVLLAITGSILSLGKSVLLPLDRLHAVLVARDTRQECAQLRRAAAHRRRAVAVRPLPPRQRVERRRTSDGSSISSGYFKGHEYPVGPLQCGREARLLAGPHLGSTILIVSGLVLLFPNFNQTRSTMQVANIVHAVVAYLSIALASVHIYLGTIGLQGAYRAMRDGDVSESWAEHHHLRWYQRIVAGKARPEIRRAGDEEAGARGSRARGSAHAAGMTRRGLRRGKMTTLRALLAAGLVVTSFGIAVAKLPPAPPMDDKAKAAAEEKKAKDASAAEAAKAQQAKAEDRVAARYIAEQRAKGKVVTPQMVPALTTADAAPAAKAMPASAAKAAAPMAAPARK